MAHDIIRDPVKNALIKDGWTITADPFTLEYGGDKVYADLAAERVLVAERQGEKILVEIKSFVGKSSLHDFEEALGKYIFYLTILEELALDYKLCLAISQATYKKAFQRKMIALTINRYKIPLIIVDLTPEEITQWINW